MYRVKLGEMGYIISLQEDVVQLLFPHVVYSPQLKDSDIF